jgi:anion-transporting  ArsA/GET3 family ATPase
MLSWRGRVHRSVKQLLRRDSILVLLGPGGVGKTTVAAALGVAAARASIETVVITLDPARRLRDALGLERLTALPARLDARRLKAAGLDPSLKLSAMVLDTKRVWDGLVERFVTAPAARRRVLENSFYRSLTEQFAGAEAYAALEQLYELHNRGRFGVEIVDTPPAAHAFEFIQAPAHLIRLLDSRAARWLFMPHAGAGKTVLALANRAASFVVGQLEQFAGIRTLSAIGEFFGAAAEAADSISDRFRKVDALLRSPAVHFVLVTTAEEDRLREARALVDQMDEEGLRLRAIVLNRLLDERTFDALIAHPGHIPAHLAAIPRLGAVLAPAGLRRSADGAIESIVGFLEQYGAYQRAEIDRAVRFARDLPARVALTAAPDIAMGVRDLTGLAKIAAIVIEGGAGRSFLERAANAMGVAQSPASGKAPPAKRRAAR